MRTLGIIDLPNQPKKEETHKKAPSHSWSDSPTNNKKQTSFSFTHFPDDTSGVNQSIND